VTRSEIIDYQADREAKIKGTPPKGAPDDAF